MFDERLLFAVRGCIYAGKNYFVREEVVFVLAKVAFVNGEVFF